MQVTIDLPDDLARRLDPESEHLVEIIRRGLSASAAGAESAVEEVIQFLARRPVPEEIVAFQASEKSQTRLRALLCKSREGSLKGDEEAELDTMETLNDLVALAKLQARRQLESAR